MNARHDHQSPHRPRNLVRRLIHGLRGNTEEPVADSRRAQRIDDAPPDWTPPVQPDAEGPQTWSDLGATQVPKSRHHGSEPVQLPESRAEAGGPPVYADPNMVNPAAAEKMRPLFRHGR
jgi:hypothetical protein